MGIKVLHKTAPLLGLLLSIQIDAQVTIGSDIPPNAGSLLDLKDYGTYANGETATKGLGLPRVKITNLKPTSDAGLAASIGNTSGSYDMANHIGLVVYNSESDQCAANPISKGIYVWDGSEWQYLGQKLTTAAPAETSQDGNPWGTDVIRHLEKKDAANNVIYKEFISADFGDAGRWMTTNFAAFLYDTDLPQNQYHTAGRTLSGPNGNTGNILNTTYWAYPKPNGAITAGEAASNAFTTNHHIGLLYTWDAATAGKGGVDGSLNMDNPNIGNPANNESGFPEWDGTGTQPADTQKRRQGICPKGWHLPSDYEWTELEQAIIRNTSRYADMADINNADPTDGNLVVQPTPGSVGTAGNRGTRHGQAMKSTCSAPGTTTITNGKSFSSHNNGTNTLLAGRANNGSTLLYGTVTFFWSASSGSTTPNVNFNSAWLRFVDHNTHTVNRSSDLRSILYSVRCKKDE